MKSRSTSLLLVVGVIGMAVPLIAHHSFSSEFNVNKPALMDGRVTLVKWGRPHVEVYIDVTDRQGKTVNWDIQLNPPNFLLDHGWKVDSLKPGMDVCVEGFPEKNGQRRFGSSSITLKATGQILKTPAGVWLWPTGQLAGEVPYTGTPSCSSRVSR